MLHVYTYSSCDTCRRATRWLRAQKIEFVEKPIRETPPTAKELREMFAFMGEDRQRVFNTAGRDYRDLKLGDQLPTMKETEAVTLLAKNGNLVKRPFVIGKGVHLTGFSEVAWGKAFGVGQ